MIEVTTAFLEQLAAELSPDWRNGPVWSEIIEDDTVAFTFEGMQIVITSQDFKDCESGADITQEIVDGRLCRVMRGGALFELIFERFSEQCVPRRK